MAGLFDRFLGGQGAKNEPSGAEIIEKLKNRVTSSTLLEDRRDAVRAIKSLAKKFKPDVGSKCIPVLVNVLRNDRSDSEIVGYAVDALWSVFEVEKVNEEIQDQLEVKFSEEFLADPENLNAVLSLLEEFEFRVRRPTTCLITALLRNKPTEVQEAILVSPGAISMVMDLLSDSREVVRNDGLLLLMNLTRSNRQIQKIVAFENAFDRLLAIIREEGFSDGGIVVEDCLIILENLLHGNSSNQSFFREASLINHLVPWFDFKTVMVHGSSEGAWSTQKVRNIYHMLKLVRIMVLPSNPQQLVTACQKAVKQSGLLEPLCVFMFSSGVPTELLTETITTVADVIRGCESNQVYFETVTTPSLPPRPAILALLMSMVTDKQLIMLRLAALYCFQCFVYKNEAAQEKIINTLLPSSSESSISSGQVLIAGLFGHDPLSNWCTAIALSNSLSEKLKTQLLRVQLSMQGQTQVTLLQQITSFLSQRSDLKVQTRIGLLILLCVWLGDCSMAVKQFLSDNSNIPFLISQLELSYTSELGQMSRCLCAALLGIILAYDDGSSSSEYSPDNLRQLITHRIGQDTFQDCLSYITGSEFFTRAAKSPQSSATSLDAVCFDYSFTLFFKQTSDIVSRALKSNFSQQPPARSIEASATANGGSNQNLSTSIEDHDSIVTHYKELIRDQDEELTALKAKYVALEKTRSGDSGALHQQALAIQSLREQVSLYANLKGQDSPDDAGGSESEVVKLQNMVVSLQKLQEAQRQESVSKDVTIQQIQQEIESLHNLHSKQIQSMSDEVKKLKDALEVTRAENEALLTERNAMDEQLKGLQDIQGRSSGAECDLSRQVKQLQADLHEVQKQKQTLEKESEDLLVFLADNDRKRKKYVSLLTQHGVEYAESEEEESGEEESEEEEVD